MLRLLCFIIVYMNNNAPLVPVSVDQLWYMQLICLYKNARACSTPIVNK